MKRRKMFLLTAYVLGSTAAVHGANFQNLDFEATRLPPDGPGGLQPVGVALPGWTAFLGNEATTDVLYNESFLGTAFVGLSGSPLYVLDGHFSARLNPGASPFTTLRVSASLAQTGLIPIGVNTLQFHATVSAFHPTIRDFFGVYIDGQRLETFPMLEDSGTLTTMFTADISAYAGREVDLRFTSFNLMGFPNGLTLDDISFVPIPEPSTWVLFGLATVALGWSLRRRSG
jgi:hypothetical protein